MLITIKVPENTSRLWFSVVEDGYENESKPVTMGMVMEVKQEGPDLKMDYKSLIEEMSESHA